MSELLSFNAHRWLTPDDFYDALLSALGAPEWHDRSLTALRDSLVGGGINNIEPPFTIEIRRGDEAGAALNRIFDALVDIAEEARSIGRMITVRFVYH